MILSIDHVQLDQKSKLAIGGTQNRLRLGYVDCAWSHLLAIPVLTYMIMEQKAACSHVSKYSD